MFAKISAIALLATAVLSAPASAAESSNSPKPYVWMISGFTSQCTPSECRYGFNVSAEAGPNGEPAFDDIGCIGNSLQGDFKPCSQIGIDLPGNVETDEKNLGDKANVFVQLKYKK